MNSRKEPELTPALHRAPRDPYIQGVEKQRDSFKPSKLKSITKGGNADVRIKPSVGPCSSMNLGIHALLSLTSSMFQYLVMTEFSGYSSISVASCSPIT